VTRQIAKLSDTALGAEGLSAAVQREVIRFVAQITATSDVPPSLGVDEDGVAVLHWLAGDLSMVIDIDETGPVHGWLHQQEKTSSTSDPLEVYVMASDGVEAVTVRTNAANPRWRNAEH